MNELKTSTYRWNSPYRNIQRPRLSGNPDGNNPWQVMEPPVRDYGQRNFDIRSDFGFKYVFNREENKDLLVHFLNSVLKERPEPVEAVQFRPTEYQGLDEALRKVIYDTLCVSNNGACFLLEMQKSHHANMERRMQFYASRLISEQVPSGKAGDQYSLKEVNMISLLDYNAWRSPGLMSHPVRRYLRSADNSWTDTRELFTNVHWHFIQLPAFSKRPEELKTDLDRWLYLFRHLHRNSDLSQFQDHPVFRKLIRVTTINNLSKKEKQNMYTLTIDAARDWRNALAYEKEEAELKKDFSFVKRLIEGTDFTDEKIADLVSVSLAFVQKVREELSAGH